MEETLDTSIAVKIWAKMFVAQFGIKMPRRVAARALEKCRNFHELSMMMSRFSEECPAAFTSMDKAFLEQLTATYNSLKFDEDLRNKSVQDLLRRDDEALLLLDDRTDEAGRALDVCSNPACMSELWNALVVFVNSASVTDRSADLVDALLAAKLGQRIVVVTADLDIDGVKTALSRKSTASRHNVAIFRSPLVAKDFSAAFPKVAATFWCVCDEHDARANAYPNGGNRQLARNLLVVTGGACVESNDGVPSDNGYGRVLLFDATSAQTTRTPNPKTIVCPFAIAGDPHLARFLCRMHCAFDGTERARGELLFVNHLLSRAPVGVAPLGVDDKGTNAIPLAILAIETRINPILERAVLLTQKNVAAKTVVLCLCGAAEGGDVHGYYRSKFPDAKILTLPSTRPFMLAEGFSMAAYEMMMSADFWTLLAAEVQSVECSHVLTVQDDGAVLRNIPEHLLRKYVSYDYVGAPWHENNLPHLKRLAGDALVGNGGVSIRSAVACATVSKDAASGRVRRMLLNGTYMMPEDVFFVSNMRRLAMSVAPRSIASEFSSEQVINAESFAVHKPYLYASAETVRKLLACVEEEEDRRAAPAP